MGKFQPRDISPVLQMFRNFLLGRQHTPALRFQPEMASRSPSPPEIPDGPAHKLNNNYYFARDVRRVIRPPLVVIKGSQKPAIGAPKDGSCPEVACKPGDRAKLPLPGKVFLWD